jgi:hypothetical protein
VWSSVIGPGFSVYAAEDPASIKRSLPTRPPPRDDLFGGERVWRESGYGISGAAQAEHENGQQQ